MIRSSFLAAALTALAVASACQQPAPAPKADAAKTESPAAAPDAEPLLDDAAMPANWQEADGPGASTIFIEDDGQRFALECSRKDSPAATTPGKFLASAVWRANESPPKSEDAALILDGAGYRAPPIWARENGRDAVFIQLEPTPELLGALARGETAMRIIAGDWFIAVAPDTKGVVARFAKACGVFAQAK